MNSTAMIRVLPLAALAVVACRALGAEKPANRPTTRPVVVVELFTSEGCSSCPPADKVLGELVKPGGVEGVEIIPLAMHVDYWNGLGWVDPFSSAAFTGRQAEYARVLRTEIYTPQMVVDGKVTFVGSRKGDAIKAVRAAAAKGDVKLEHVEISADGKAVTGKVVIGPAVGANADVLVMVTEDGLSSDVRRGENAGQALRHDGVVRSMEAFAPEGGRIEAKAAILPGWRAENLNLVVVVQERGTMRVLGAARVKLK